MSTVFEKNLVCGDKHPVYANIAYAGEVAYSVTKALINHMTRAGAIDHARDCISGKLLDE
jgi:hypothetical protein